MMVVAKGSREELPNERDRGMTDEETKRGTVGPETGRARELGRITDPSRDDEADPEVKAEQLNWVRPARLRTRPERCSVPRGAARPAEAPGEAERDPVTLQQHVGERFVQDGNRFYFRDGRLAFRDHGRKLTTAGENIEVIATLMEMARLRGWQEVSIGGTKRFCRQAWRHGRLSGLDVRGYAPSATEHAGLIRALSDKAKSGAAQDGAAEEPTAAVDGDTPLSRPRNGREELITGTLLVHGIAPYRSNPRKEIYYFIRIGTDKGARTIWAKDLKRAMEQSRSQPKVGDLVVLHRIPSDRLPSRPLGGDREEPVRDEQGRLNRRQGWVIEKRDFFEARAKAAETLRSRAISAREGVRQHPELAGSYANLHAAELVARRMKRPEDQKEFVETIRERLADSIARGDPFPRVRVRVRVDGSEGTPDLERGPPLVRG
jgi:hypothetical protein